MTIIIILHVVQWALWFAVLLALHNHKNHILRNLTKASNNRVLLHTVIRQIDSPLKDMSYIRELLDSMDKQEHIEESN